MFPPRMVVALKKTGEDVIEEYGWDEHSALPEVAEAIGHIIAAKPN